MVDFEKDEERWRRMEKGGEGWRRVEKDERRMEIE